MGPKAGGGVLVGLVILLKGGIIGNVNGSGELLVDDWSCL